MQAKFIHSIHDIEASAWNEVCGDSYPFLRHEFLAALETSSLDNSLDDTKNNAACSAQTGWQPHHLLIYQAGQLIALMPCYIKHHSYGEYIFDWAWAEAYHRHGIHYYPKLFCGIPFTPATGPRIAIAPQYANTNAVLRFALESVKEECESLGLSSFHLLFAQQDCSKVADSLGFTQRSSFQYHWFNRGQNNQKFQSFDEFLQGFKSRKRKALRKERMQVGENKLTIKRLCGSDIDEATWRAFHHFYQITYAKRSGHGGYLPAHFFTGIGKSMPENLMMVVAYDKGELIAAALNFVSPSALYGRYWGCTKAFEFLHFELCYYQGIEFCIERGLSHFDAGAQGEHKIQRGFEPVNTFSNHWIVDRQFRDAINHYIKQEAKQNKEWMQQARGALPFKSA